MANKLRVLEVARAVRDEVNELLSRPRCRLLHRYQLSDSAQSIAGNIREAYGRRPGPDRKRFLVFARGSAEESDEHLRSNFTSSRLDEKTYWRLHHRLTLICKMLTPMIDP